ncbi:hypothetical protein LJC49_06130 [Ruminococcaceae bacterium OttesenSCG-928-I18]|nr:hypothetical protein [Ruminococcaceae bacterium OttesenSCG-928-I18]
MAVAPMKYLNVYGPEDKLPQTLSSIARCQLFAPEEDEAIHSALEQGKNEYEPLLTKAKGLLKDLGRSSLAADFIGDEDAYTLEYADEYLEKFAAEVAERNRRKTEIENQMGIHEKTVGLLSHMTDLDINIEELFTVQYLKVRIGRLPKESYPRLSYYVDKGFNFSAYFNFIVYDFDGEYYWGLYFAPKESAKEIDDIFRSLYFERVRVPDFVHGTPEEALQTIRDEEVMLRDELNSIITPAGVAMQEEIQTIENITAWLYHKNQLYEMNKYATVFDHIFYISGFVLEENYEQFEKLIDKLGSVQIKEASETQELPAKPPVVVENKGFAQPFQMFTEMYGLPGYKELDPTLMVSIVYSVAYGLMFADVGQGLVLGLIGYFFMWKRKNMVLGRILTRCALFCCLFGFAFGSIFGYEHAFDPLWHAFGLHEKPIEVMSATNITGILVMALCFGALVVLTAIVTNIIQQLRNRHWGNAIADRNGVAGLVFYASLILLAIDLVVLKIGFSTTVPYILLCLVLPLVVIWLAEPLAEIINGEGLKMEHPGEVIVSGFFELFDALLEYLSNTVSFLRVAGFIWVHAGMMMVVMSLSEMVPPGVSVLIVIVGNVFVIALEGLIVGIQALRLNYYEVFSRFYAPDGKPFVPLRVTSDTVEM